MKTKPPLKRINQNPIKMPLWIVPVIVGLAIGTVWLRLFIIRTTYEINETDKMIQGLRQAREQAELKLTGMKSPRKLETLARSRFKLTHPKPEQLVYVK